MPLINILQAANYVWASMNERSEIKFLRRPKCYEWVLDFKASPGIMAIPNGFGKTSTANGFYALLSHDKNLWDSAKSRMASRDMKPSHIRAEFLLPKYSASVASKDYDYIEKHSEKHVLGMFGHRNGDLYMYSYKGTIEDLPIYTSPTGKHSLWYDETMTVDSFDEYLTLLEDQEAYIEKNRKGVTEWRTMVEETLSMSPEVIKELVDFQNAGGDDKAASLFEFKELKKHGLSAQASFFHQKIAPRLFKKATARTVKGQRDERPLTDVLKEEGLKIQSVVKDRLRAKEVFDQLETDVKSLNSLVGLVKDRVDLQSLQTQTSRSLTDVFASYEYLCTKGRMPSMPTWKSSGDPSIDILTKHMVICKENGLTLLISGLAQLLQVERFRLSDREKIDLSPLLSPQDPVFVQDITKSPKSNTDLSGKAVKMFAAISAFRDKYVQPSLLGDRTANEIAEIIERAFDFAGKHLWDSSLHDAYRSIQTHYEEWERKLTNRCIEVDGHIAQQIKDYKDKLEVIESSPAQKKLNRLREDLAAAHKQLNNLTPNGFEACKTIRERFSDMGATAIEIDKTREQNELSYSNRLTPLQTELDKTQDTYRALLECGDTPKVFLNKRQKEVEDLGRKIVDQEKSIENLNELLIACKERRIDIPEETRIYLDRQADIPNIQFSTWVEQNLPHDEHRKVLSAYSSLLHCRVCKSESDARKLALKLVNEKNLSPIPIFDGETLRKQVSGIRECSEQSSGYTAVAGALVGAETEQVTALYDPDALEARKQRLTSEISTAEQELQDLDSKKKILEKINGNYVQDLLAKADVFQTYPLNKKEYDKIKDAQSALLNRFANYKQCLSNALVFEQTLDLKSEISFEDLPQKFDLLSSFEENESKLLQEHREYLNAAKDTRDRVNKKLERWKGVQRHLPTKRKKKISERIIQKQRQRLDQQQSFERYFSQLTSIRQAYKRLLEKADNKSFTPFDTSKAGPLQDEIANMTEETLQSYTTEPFGQDSLSDWVENQVLPKLEVSTTDPLFDQLSEYKWAIDSKTNEIQEAQTQFLSGMNPKFPAVTRANIQEAVAQYDYEKLLREFAAVKGQLADNKAGYDAHTKMLDDTKEILFGNLTHFTKMGLRNLRTLKKVCGRPEVKNNTLVITANAIQSDEAIEAVIREVIETFVADANEEKGSFQLADLEIEFYKRLFNDPQVKIIHSTIDPTGVSFDLEAGRSTGENTAVGLLLLARLNEYAAAVNANRSALAEGNFIIVDGLFSNCSRSKLWKGSLKNLDASRGAFQLIGFMHDTSFVNDFDTFPKVYYGVIQNGEPGSLNSFDEFTNPALATNNEELRLVKGWETRPKNAGGNLQ